MRILMTNWVYMPEFSGAGLQCHRLSKELTQMGVQVKVLTGTHELGLVGQDNLDGISVFRYLRDRTSISGHIKYWWDIDRYIQTNKKNFDLIHTHGFHPRVNLAAKRAGLPIIQKITGQSLDDPLSVSDRRFGHHKFKIYSLAEAVVATSKKLQELCEASPLPKNRIVRIPNGVDTALFHPVSNIVKEYIRSNFYTSNDKVVLLTVGTVNYDKGLDTLIKAIYELEENLKTKMRLWIIGPTSNLDSYGNFHPDYQQFVSKVKKMISELGLNNIVQFKGQQTNVNEYMQAADIYVHPTRKEGHPNAILEAMACGLPIVANLLPGITDEILQTGRFGYLVNAEDSEVFASALRVLLKNETLRRRLGDQARKEALRRYNMTRIAQRYRSLYSSIIHKETFDKLKNKTRLTKSKVMTSWR